ncbi:MAG: hypothetical protein ACOCVB_01645, partial [Bacillota bacterium]
DDIGDTTNIIDILSDQDDFDALMDESEYNTLMYRDGFNNELLERGNISLATYNELGNAKGLEDYTWEKHTGYVASFEEDGEISSVDTIKIDYRECTPSLVHINGAVEIVKATGYEAGQFHLGTITLTASAADDSDGQ